MSLFLDDEAVASVTALLNLVRFDELAISWARNVPEELLPEWVVDQTNES